MNGPGGNLYVGSQNTDEVLRYNGATGDFMGARSNSPSIVDEILRLAYNIALLGVCLAFDEAATPK